MVWCGVVELPIIGPPQLTLFIFGLDWVVAIICADQCRSVRDQLFNLRLRFLVVGIKSRV